MAAPHLSAALVGELTRLKGRPAAHIALTDAKVETPLGPRPLPPCVQAVAAVEWPAGQVLTTKDGDEWEVRVPAAPEVEAGVFGDEPERAWFAIRVFEHGGRWLVDLDEAAATDDPLVAFEGGGFGRGSFWAKPLSQRLTWLKAKRPPAKRYHFGRDCVSGDVDAVKAHIAAGASLGPAKSGDPTPLHLAAMASRSPEVVRLLVEAGADLEARVDKEPKSLRVYGDRDRFPRLHLLQYATPLVVAIGALASRSPEAVAAVPGIVDVLLSAGADPEARNGVGDTVLGAAAGTRTAVTLTVVERLLAAGAEIEPRGGNGPLMGAVRGNEEIVPVLLAAGADPCRSCEYGYVPGTRKPTPLHKAAHEGSAEVLRLLIAAGADVDVLSADGVAPLHCAAAGDDPERVRLLLAAGADPGARLAKPAGFREGLSGGTPLEIARELGKEENAAILAGL